MSSATSDRPYVGIPLSEREPQMIRDALADRGKTIVECFLKLHEYARKEHLGISRLAQQVSGVSQGVLSQAFNGSYPGDYEAIVEQIDAFFWRLEQKAKYGGIRQFVDTRLAKSLWAVFEKTRVIRRIQIIESPEQLGKTRIADEYAARNNSGRTIMTTLSGGTRNGCGDFIWTLSERLGIAHTIKLREKRIRIRQQLETCDLLIIDEAHLAWSWTDRSIAEFWDYLRTDLFANGERGVVLIYTNSNAMSEIHRFGRRARYNTGQLLGRMRNDVITIDPAEDIVEEDVMALMARYYKPGKETIRLMHSLAMRDQLGHFGLVDDIMTESWSRAKAHKKDLADEIVQATAREIVETLKGRENLLKK